MGKHPLLMVLPEVRDKLGIAMGGEMVPLGLELLLGLGVVEKLAVEDGGHRAVFVIKRLLAVRQSDNAETAVGQTQAEPLKVAVVVGTAVPDGVGHAPQNAGRYRSPPGEIDNTRDA